MAEIDRWLAGINYEPGAARCGRGHSWAKAIADEMDSHVQTGACPGQGQLQDSQLVTGGSSALWQ